MKKLEKLFQKHEEEFCRFENIENPAHPCPDICAFILLAALSPLDKGQDLICRSNRNELFFNVDEKIIAKNITEDQVLTLVRCGVRYEPMDSGFCMFV